MPGAKELSTVEWQSAQVMPTDCRRLPFASKKPRTPTTELSLSSASVVAGLFEVHLALAQGRDDLGRQGIDVHLEPDRERRLRAHARAGRRHWRCPQWLGAGGARRPRMPGCRTCPGERSCGRARIRPRRSRCLPRRRSRGAPNLESARSRPTARAPRRARPAGWRCCVSYLEETKRERKTFRLRSPQPL